MEFMAAMPCRRRSHNKAPEKRLRNGLLFLAEELFQGDSSQSFYISALLLMTAAPLWSDRANMVNPYRSFAGLICTISCLLSLCLCLTDLASLPFINSDLGMIRSDNRLGVEEGGDYKAT